MEPLYRPIVWLTKALLRVLGWRVQVSGSEHLPRSGPAVVASNHISYLDALLVGYALEANGRLPRFLAKVELFELPLFGRMLRQMRHVPVDRYGQGAGRALRTAVERLRAGEVVAIFPEGTIATSFVPAADEAKSGAARIAMTAGVPLLPLATWGGQRIGTKHRPLRVRRRIALAVRIGEPIAYEPGEDPAAVTARLMAALAALVDEAVATYPQRPAGPDDRWWIPRHLGGTAPSVEAARAARDRERAQKRARRREPGGRLDEAG